MLQRDRPAEERDQTHPSATLAISGPARRDPWRDIVATLFRGAIVLVVCLVLLGLASGFLVDWLWFTKLGYVTVFWTTIATEILVFLTVFAATATSLGINSWLALRAAHRRQFLTAPVQPQTVGMAPLDQLRLVRHRLPWRWVIAAGAGIVAIAVAWFELGNWMIFLGLLYGGPYGVADPLYGNDIGFYLFSLPALIKITHWLLLTLVLSALFAGAIYWIYGEIELEAQRRWASPIAILHGSVLLGVIFLVKAWSYWLDRYLLLYADNGVVVGAGFTSIHVELPVLWSLVGIAVAAALVSWSNIRIRGYPRPLIAVAMVYGATFVLAGVVPGLFQRFFVKPNELQWERPYIQNNITLTQMAYNLHQVVVKPFPAEQDLTFKALQANRATIDNIRLWDWHPLMDTYAQLQEIRTYYKFHDADVDRYWLDGKYQSVMLSARELQSSLLPPNAQTWVNRHLLFTHGNGVVMSPVTRKSPEGLPLLYLRDIPPVADGGPEVREPRIYFGEKMESYVIVKSKTPEFDYPKGKDNAYAKYDGNGGIALDGIGRKTLFSYYFGDVNLLLSDYIGDASRILIRRDIQERVRTIAPFLHYDRDPYLVVSDGRLFWMLDAYTTSSYFPYAKPAANGSLNYIRNAVKVVIDAYNGATDFYLIDSVDPIAATYQRIFPELFKPISAMPADLRRHIRYAEDMFLIQAQIYRTYHMDQPDVFYNREDLWQFPRLPAGSPTTTMMPYYIIMRLPGEPQAEFVVMLPMVPSGRDNMIAWLAGRCDPPDYGKLIVYEFPKEKLIYGPLQIEARINQNTEISQQLSLWNQMGSRVIRGNLLVIPIEDSILYVSPLYLRALEGHLPELKRVIASYGERVVMKETLEDALMALFVGPTTASPDAEAAAPGIAADRAREALQRYDQAMEHLKAGDWAGYGTKLEALRRILNEMAR
jgi:uncharacterized membrane protein (UPF0182 family)